MFAQDSLDVFTEYYDFDGPLESHWCDFENDLANFCWSSFYDNHRHMDFSSENFKHSLLYCLHDDLEEQTECHVEEMRGVFENWVDTIDVSSAKTVFVFPEDIKFFTFNYTSTLQSVYGISEDRVFHVHGSLKSDDELVFGHGEKAMAEMPELDENGDRNSSVFTYAENAAKYPFYAFQKNVNEIIKSNRCVFESFDSMSKIIVLGHSINEVDRPYFREIAKFAPQAKWFVSFFEEKEELHHLDALIGCGIVRENIQICTWSELKSIVFAS